MIEMACILLIIQFLVQKYAIINIRLKKLEKISLIFIE